MTREEYIEQYPNPNQIGFEDAYEILDENAEKYINLLEQRIAELEANIIDNERLFVEYGQIAHRALLIGDDEHWFECNSEGYRFSSLETDLKKIRDNSNVFGFTSMMNKAIDAYKQRIAELEMQLADANSYFSGIHTELEAPKTCLTCKYLSFSEDRTCDHKHMSSYYGMSFEINTFYCSNYEQKDNNANN